MLTLKLGLGDTRPQQFWALHLPVAPAPGPSNSRESEGQVPTLPPCRSCMISKDNSSAVRAPPGKILLTCGCSQGDICAARSSWPILEAMVLSLWMVPVVGVSRDNQQMWITHTKGGRRHSLPNNATYQGSVDRPFRNTNRSSLWAAGLEGSTVVFFASLGWVVFYSPVWSGPLVNWSKAGTGSTRTGKIHTYTCVFHI